MAKKVVATLQKGGGKGYTKAIKMVRSSKTGAYTFKEKIVLKEDVTSFLQEKQIDYSVSRNKLIYFYKQSKFFNIF